MTFGHKTANSKSQTTKSSDFAVCCLKIAVSSANQATLKAPSWCAFNVKSGDRFRPPDRSRISRQHPMVRCRRHAHRHAYTEAVWRLDHVTRNAHSVSSDVSRYTLRVSRRSTSFRGCGRDFGHCGRIGLCRHIRVGYWFGYGLG